MPKAGKMRGKMPHKPGADLASLKLYQETYEMTESVYIVVRVFPHSDILLRQRPCIWDDWLFATQRLRHLP